ncbi:MAG: 16S rRNA (cytosine(967)-C(5))-methyltransferase RsmB [Gammaproteobacteria bacterium]|nr:16S rRNA (cytosine(967)-C(5))-methyltransferase RsmB [Gammaproteobacteria bacterium]
MSARLAAVRCIVEVLARGRMLDEVIPGAVTALSARDRALAQEISYGVLRWYHRFDPVVDHLLHRPMSPADLDVKVLLLAALHEIEHLRTPDHAAVSEAVEGARQLGKPWAAGLINALLRRFLRERANVFAALNSAPEVRYSHPGWLIEALRGDWPDHWEQILARGNEHPPMDIRVNARHCPRDEYAGRLAAAGIPSRLSTLTDCGLRLAGAANVQELPGFDAGAVTVQDLAAQLAAPLLEVKPDQRVLDACAAPGGKASQILEACPAAKLVAVDRGPDRVRLLAQNLKRLRLSATLIDGDAARPEHWWDKRPFDRILLDAPCSATGVIRRHPDIKCRRGQEQLPRLAKIQAALLDALWPLLAPGGRLLYVTCSLLRRENDAQIEKFSASHKDVRVLPITSTWGIATTWGRQSLPSVDDTDGFYHALLERR